MKIKETTPIPPEAKTAALKAIRYQSRLKYYIHDSIDVLRLELTGELTEGDLGELDGCWRTAKTTLGRRRLLLDLRRLQAADHEGRRWLTVMSTQETASFLPEHPTHLHSAGQIKLQPTADASPKRQWLDRLLGFWRGARVSVTKSSTPAP